jgi:hypothetical protein
MKKEVASKCNGLKSKTSDEKEATLKCKGLKEKTFDTNQKVRNRQLTEGSFNNLTFEGEDDAFRSDIKHYVGN